MPRKASLLRRAEKVLGPAPSWVGRCYAVACAFVRHELVEGVAVYGHWLGPVNKKSIFAGRPGFVQHGWVIRPGGTIVDPTQWCFYAVRPYVFEGKDTNSYYDEGGNKWRAAARSRRPPPFEQSDEVLDVGVGVMNTQTWNFVERLLQLDYSEQAPGELSLSQLQWLAHAPPQELGAHAPFVFDALEKLGKRALIPIDNYHMVQRLRMRPGV